MTYPRDMLFSLSSYFLSQFSYFFVILDSMLSSPLYFHVVPAYSLPCHFLVYMLFLHLLRHSHYLLRQFPTLLFSSFILFLLFVIPASSSSFLHLLLRSHYLLRHSRILPVIPSLFSVIPAKAGIQRIINSFYLLSFLYEETPELKMLCLGLFISGFPAVFFHYFRSISIILASIPLSMLYVIFTLRVISSSFSLITASHHFLVIPLIFLLFPDIAI